jgi:DNA repair protein RadC
MDIVQEALKYIDSQYARGEPISSPQRSADYFCLKLGLKENEVFCALWLDSKHRIIEYQEMFHGTIDNASVPVREVVKKALAVNAAAVVFAHNHPSGVCEPSAADKSLTETLYLSLGMVGCKVLDHIVVGGGTYQSFAQMGALS